MNTAQLYTCFLKSTSVCTDTRKLKKGDIFFALKGDHFNGNKFAQQALEAGAKYAVIDEKAYATANTILVENTLKSLQDLAKYHREQLGLTIIALTGSNGKTTTKELINTVLSQKYNTVATIGNLNNHIGVPLTLLSMDKSTEIGIVEMGANHLKEIEFLSNIVNPDFGYITNFGKAHLEGFGGVEGVIKGKSELYNHLKTHNKTIFVNEDDTIQVDKTNGSNIYTFSENKTTSDVTIQLIKAKPLVQLSYNNLKIESHLIGLYNFKNIAAAIAIGHYFNVESNAIKKAIESYIPSNNRSQVIEKNSNKIILDAYNANPTSMKAALESFEKLDGDKIIFLGDMFELGQNSLMEHQAIVNAVEKMPLKTAYLVGENFGQTTSSKKNIKIFKTFEDLKTDLSHSEKTNASTILIKGSRGMAMERILDLL